MEIHIRYWNRSHTKKPNSWESCESAGKRRLLSGSSACMYTKQPTSTSHVNRHISYWQMPRSLANLSSPYPRLRSLFLRHIVFSAFARAMSKWMFLQHENKKNKRGKEQLEREICNEKIVKIYLISTSHSAFGFADHSDALTTVENILILICCLSRSMCAQMKGISRISEFISGLMWKIRRKFFFFAFYFLMTKLKINLE